MTNVFLITAIILLLIVMTLIIIAIRKISDSTNMRNVKDILNIFGSDLNKIGTSLNNEFQRNRDESLRIAKDNRGELKDSLELINDRLSKNINDQAGKTETRLENMRKTIESKLTEIQSNNDTKLELMRKTVDEKLQETLNTRITESFQLVSKQLEDVHKGLGDMQSLASGVGDLKKVLSNVKTRGILGEIQLGAILEQYLSADQYIKNINIKHGSRENVEFAIKLPGNENPDEPLLLPIDSKFPIEDYQRLLEIYENISDYQKDDIIRAEKAFDASVIKSAKTIHQKYISPPVTTNFAIMFVPTEGLYAQILTRTGLFEQLQREYNITVVGPSNLVAFLSSLQMGFRTLAVQKSSNEVWKILGAVKTEFRNFEKILVMAQKQITTASGSLDKLVGVRTRAIQRQLRNIEELPGTEANKILEEDINEPDTEDIDNIKPENDPDDN